MAATEREQKDFIRAYIECALWSSHDWADDSGGDPLEKNYSADDLADEARKIIEQECIAFCDANADDIDQLPRAPDGDSRYSYAGHLFWLTRNRHGTGFWDRDDFPEDVRERLDAASKAAGERDISVGDDGRLHYSHA